MHIAGRDAIHSDVELWTFFSTLCKGDTWWTMDTRKPMRIDQCPSCRTLFHDVSLLEPNDAMSTQLGAKYEKGRGWQCAEADLIAQIADFNLV